MLGATGLLVSTHACQHTNDLLVPRMDESLDCTLSLGIGLDLTFYTCGLDRKYRALVSIVCLSVCKHDNSKNKWSRILKFKYIVGYEKSSDEFDIGHCPIKVKVTV